MLNINNLLIGIPQECVWEFLIFKAHQYSARVFIETGTHLGNTAMNMALSGESAFDHIHTIEIDKEIFNSLSKIFTRQSEKIGIDDAFNKIICHHGDSRKKLPEILTDTNTRAIFWLDAHCSEGMTSSAADKDCVLLDELAMIKNHYIKEHVILIDDIDDVLRKKKGYPSLQEIVNGIYSINKDYAISMIYGILVAEIPSSMKYFGAVHKDNCPLEQL